MTLRRVADLCCGIGGDLLALAAGREVLAVDRDAAHARLAVHNAGVYGVADGVRACVCDVRDVRLAGIGAVFVDPARRRGLGTGSPQRGVTGAGGTGAGVPVRESAPRGKRGSLPGCPSPRSTGASPSPSAYPPSASRPRPACPPS